MTAPPIERAVTGPRRRLPERDIAVDILGVLTIAVYGSWYYGFGVLIDDIGEGLSMSATQLGIAFGLAQVLLGLLSLVTGRILDRHGPSFVLGLIGPLGAILVGFAGRATVPWQFIVCFALGGGVSAAAGFYGMTQSIIVRLDPERSMQRIIRLTIWGALASPIAIPVTEVLRSTLGWRLAIELPAGFAVVVFLVASRIIRRAPAPTAPPPSSRRWSSVMASVVREPIIRWHVIAIFFASVSVSVLLVFQLSIMRWAGLSASAAAAFAGARGFVQLAGRLPLRRILERVGPWSLLRIARGFIVLACLTILVSGNPVMAALYVAFAGAGIGAISALDGIVARDVLPADDFGSLMGAVALIGAVGGGVAPVLAGRLTDATGSPAATSIVAAVAAVVSIAGLEIARAHRFRDVPGSHLRR